VAAQAHTGISISNGAVLRFGKTFSIEVVGNKTTNPGLTAEDIYHWLQANLASTALIDGLEGVLYHNMLKPFGAGYGTETGAYTGLKEIRGVSVVDENGDPFPGIVRMQADDGTFYTPPVNVFLTLTGLQDGSEVRVYEAGTTTEIAGQEVVNGGTFSSAVTVSSVDISVLSLGFQNLRLKSVDTTSNATLPIQQIVDRQYAND
jgi:hypothetical protein